MQRLIISLAIALGLVAPAVAFAQTSTTGLLTVYVQVLQNSAFGQTFSPSQVSVSVSGQNPSLTNFPGSQSGTAVSLNPGSYNVTAGNLPGYAASYSSGCSSTIAAGQTQLCVVTMSPSYAYNPYPTPYNYNQYNNYPYGYYVQPLSCQVLTPNVAVNQQASFRAVGGAGGTYNWATNWQNYPNAGQTVNASFPVTGVQTITVTNAAQTATCSVNVTNAYSAVNYPYYYPQYNQYPTTQYPTYYGNSYYPNVTGPTYYPTTYPQLPRTGFGPHDNSFAWAIAAVLMLAAGIMTAPYARKAFAVVSR